MQAPDTTSMLLQEMAHRLKSRDEVARVTIGDFVDTLAERGFSLAILLCAIPNLFPVNIPGISTVFAFIIALLVLQWMVGMQHPWLPEFIRRRSFDAASFANGLNALVPRMQRMEQWLKPRAGWCLNHVGVMVTGVCILIQCGVLVLPLPMIPFSNAIPAFFIAAMAIGILARDGYLLIGAMISGTVAIYFLSFALYEVISHIWEALT